MRAGKRVIRFVLGALILSGAVALATERVECRYDHDSGLIVSTIFGLAQDRQGFIWIGTAGGLVRYDGSEMRPWAKDLIDRDVFTIQVSPSGEVLVAEGDGTLYRITSESVEPIIGSAGKPFTATHDAGFDSAGNLWVVTADGGLHARDALNGWQSFNVANLFPGEVVRRIRPSSGGPIYVLTNKAVWQMRVGAGPRRLLEVMRPVEVVEHPGGSVFVLAWQIEGELIELQPDGSAVKRVAIYSRPIDLVLRGDVLWASSARHLVSLRGNEAPEINEIPSGGPLLVDHENSLWLGTFGGLVQYPEPQTTIFNQKDGLTTPHTRSLAKTDEGIWVATWAELGRIAREGNAWRVYREPFSGMPCVDGRGLILVTGKDGLMQWSGGRFVKRSPLPGGVGFHDCARASDGTLLITTPRGIYRDLGEGKTPEAITSPPGENGAPASVERFFEDGEKRFWVTTNDGRVCQANAGAVLSGQSVSWSCQTIDDSPNGFDFAQMPGGNVWMSTNRAGVWRLRGDRWEPIPASRNLPSQIIFNLTLSPAGGVWLVGQGTTIRVVERQEKPEGWEVVEVLSTWEGLPGSETTDLIEEPEGHLWLSTPSGAVRVPAEARRAEAAPPRVRLVDVVVNGIRGNAKSDLSQLPHRSQVELHFAALSYRDRGRLRYQYRLRSDSAWIESRDAALRFVDLRAGDYQAEVRASLDGVNWTAEHARLAFEVLSPWYLRPVSLALFVLIAASALYAAYRARIGVLTRLERQRARIALDLHDEMGSGLGSIGILSGLAAHEDLDVAKRRDLAKKIAETAGELGNSLVEIVWALKPAAPTLEALAYHLAERAGRLFPADQPTFTTDFPEHWPRVELSLAVRRNLLLIASEALHNAARHSQANRITLGLMAMRGRHWRLWITDDGSGLEENGSTAHGSGMGLASIRRRAEEIGGELSWTSNNGRGTTISVVFDPRARDRRLD